MSGETRWSSSPSFEVSDTAAGAGSAPRPGDAEAHNGLGIALMLAGRRDDALRSFQQAAALDPRFAANL